MGNVGDAPHGPDSGDGPVPGDLDGAIGGIPASVADVSVMAVGGVDISADRGSQAVDAVVSVLPEHRRERPEGLLSLPGETVKVHNRHGRVAVSDILITMITTQGGDMETSLPEARRRVLGLIDHHDWSLPDSLSKAKATWDGLRRLERAAAQVPKHGDTLSHLLSLRLMAFRTHWPQPPSTVSEMSRFMEDLTSMVRQDVPRICRTLADPSSSPVARQRPRRPASEQAIRA